MQSVIFSRLVRRWRRPRSRFADILDAYFLDCQAAGHADTTIATRRRVLGRFGAWLAGTAYGLDLSQHDSAVAAEYLAGCRREGYARGTLQLFASTLRAFSSRAFDLDLIPRDVYRRLRIPAAKRTVRVVLTRDEVARLVATAGADRRAWVHPAVLLMVGCGLRRGEVAGLRWRDLNFDDSTIFVRGKGDHERMVGMPMAVRIALRRLATVPRGAPGPVIGVNTATLSRVTKTLGRRAGLSKPIAPHALRRTYATLAHGAGASLAAIARTLGHANTGTTERWYVQLDTPDLLAAVRFSPVSEPGPDPAGSDR